MDSAGSSEEAQSYPPYNIEKTGEDYYRLSMAVAGFRPEDLDITVTDNTLFVSGRVANEAKTPELLRRGIVGRPFERRFVLADHVVVEGADAEHGLLHVRLKRVVPESLRPRKIVVGNGTRTTVTNEFAKHRPRGLTPSLTES